MYIFECSIGFNNLTGRHHKHPPAADIYGLKGGRLEQTVRSINIWTQLICNHIKVLDQRVSRGTFYYFYLIGISFPDPLMSPILPVT